MQHFAPGNNKVVLFILIFLPSTQNLLYPCHWSFNLCRSEDVRVTAKVMVSTLFGNALLFFHMIMRPDKIPCPPDQIQQLCVRKGAARQRQGPEIENYKYEYTNAAFDSGCQECFAAW